MKKWIYLGLMSSLFSITVLIFSFKSSTTEPKKLTYSGEELFKGVYFREGQVGAIIKTSTNAANQTIAYNGTSSSSLLVNNLISRLKKKDPNFFTNFKKVISSGDPLAIETCLLKGQASVDQMLAVTLDNKTIKTNRSASGIAVEMLPVYTFVVLPPPPVLANVVYVVANSPYASIPSMQKIEPQSLQTESLSYTIAEQFNNTK